MSMQKDRQRFYDETLTFLRTQGCKSYRYDACLYRGANNTKCAIGKWIPDSNYDLYMERTTIRNSDVILGVLPKWIQKLGVDFLSDVQFLMHDKLEPNKFKIELEIEAESFAKKYKLTYTPPV